MFNWWHRWKTFRASDRYKKSWYGRHRKKLITGVVLFAHVLGASTSVRAVMETRTPQGAIAWVVSLNTFPYVSVPAYWVLGRREFNGYVLARSAKLAETDEFETALKSKLNRLKLTDEAENETENVLERLAHMPMVGRNDARLLIDGKATFDAIFEAIDSAQSYILVQFFIIKDDTLGNDLRERLERKSRDGVEVYVIYDEIGSHALPRSYVNSLRNAGANIVAFNTTQGSANRFQVNFRNHRKIVVVDGKSAFVGGHNVGDEYVDGGRFNAWRDTHVALEGPIVQAIQIPFAEDWYWAAQERLLNLDWDPKPSANGNTSAICFPTGPADTFETCALFFLTAINGAKERLWIASPYFVPDEAIMYALQLAAIRGVDVRVLLPNDPDHKLVYLASFSFLQNAEKAGVKIYRYLPGFMHQKVVLVDQEYSAVGTANLDNRSFRLNFEIMMLFEDTKMNQDVAAMLEKDFENSRLVPATDYTDQDFLFRLGVQISRLTAPIL